MDLDTVTNSDECAKRAIVVLGMHRSGTSLCMNILHELGVELDEDLITRDENNSKGYFESREIVQLNDRILAVLGIAWHTLSPVALDERWYDDSAIAPFKQRLISIIRAQTIRKDNVWGFKDPRLCLLLPLYERIFFLCGVEPQYVVCVRNPVSVARSLEARNHFPPLLTELLWIDHTFRAIRAVGSRLKAVVHYERWFSDPEAQAYMLATNLSLPLSAEPLAERLRRVIDPELNHESSTGGPCTMSPTAEVYRLLRNGDNWRAAVKAAEIDRALRLVTAPVSNTCQLFWRTEDCDVFCETNSNRVVTDLLPSSRVIHLAVPAGLQRLTGLRLDPASMHGIAHVYAIRLLDSHAAPLWEWDACAMSLLKWESYNVQVLPDRDGIGALLDFLNHDPALILPVSRELEAINETGGMLEFEFAWWGTLR